MNNFDDPNIINNLNYTPEKCIYTANTQDEVIELDLSKYDEVTVTSANNLTNPNIKYIPSGLISLATPIKGLLLAAPYSSTLLTGKSINKKKLISTYRLPEDGYICLVAGLMNDNVLDEIIDAIPTILETGGSIIIATLSNHRYIDKIKPYKDNPRVVFFDRNPSAAVIPLLLAGSDFYLHPNKSTMSNLIPLLAGAYGTTPIIGTETEFNDSDIIINNNYEEAIRCAADLYMNQPKQLANMRKNIMESIPSWDDRKQAYINLYENNKA